MPSKLKYYLDKKGNKVYTLKSKSPENTPTKEAHYKFLHIRSVKENEKAQDSE